MHEKCFQSRSSGSPTAAYKGPPPSRAWFWAQHSIRAGLVAHAQLSFQVIVDVNMMTGNLESSWRAMASVI